MARNAGFGYILLTHFSGDTRIERIGTIDIDYVKDQYNPNAKNCHIRTNNGFCQSSFTVQESPGEVLSLIADHDRDYIHFVRDFAARNNIVLMKGELW